MMPSNSMKLFIKSQVKHAKMSWRQVSKRINREPKRSHRSAAHIAALQAEWSWKDLVPDFQILDQDPFDTENGLARRVVICRTCVNHRIISLTNHSLQMWNAGIVALAKRPVLAKPLISWIIALFLCRNLFFHGYPREWRCALNTYLDFYICDIFISWFSPMW